MKKHYLYFKYVIRHKWFVAKAGVKVGASWWRLLKHDWSKLTLAEWHPYVNSFYGQWKYKERPQWLVESFDAAWLHHQHWNDHHWQHWVLREDSGAIKLLEMPKDCVFEMVADWAGAGRVITGKWEVASWYQLNREKIQLHSATRNLVEILLTNHFLIVNNI
jgi:hypothetical protein